MPAQFDDAIAIRLWDYSETSQTVSVLTRAHGVIRGLAKGSKRPRHPFSGGFEVLSRGELGFIAKPTTELALLTSWDLEEIYPALRTRLKCHYGALYAADLVHHLLQPRDPHPELFDELLHALRSLSHDEDVMPALARFQWSLLHHAGYRPDLGDNARGDLEFVPRIGRVRARAGPSTGASEADAPAPAWRVRGATIDGLRAIRAAVDAGTPAPVALSADAAQRGARLLAAYIRFLLDQHLPTATLVFPDLRAEVA